MQIQRVQDQIGLTPIPEEHPTVPQLKDEFGEHTFFLVNEGLAVLHPAKNPETGRRAAVLVKVAGWTTEEHNELAVLDPEPTDLYIALDADGPDRAD
jgi:hypothetical protein